MKQIIAIGTILLLISVVAVFAVEWDAPVSLSVRDTPMQDVLRLLAQQNGFSIVTHSDSLGTVSVAFNDVPLRSALAAILSARGMSARYEGSVIITRPDTLINPAELETVVLRLRYVDATDAKAMIDSSKVLSKKGRAVVLTPSAASRYLAPFGWIQTQEISQRGPKVGDRGEAKSEIIMISDLPQYIPKVEQIMRVIDRPPRQYAIEARFVETILSKDDKFGIDWENILAAEGGTGKRTEWSLGTPPAAASDATSTSTASSYLTFGTLSGMQFKSVLDALQQNGDSKLVSQPRIVAQDRQSSVMEAGVTYWIATKQATQGVGGISESYTYTERLIPVRLIVTPQLIADSLLMMEVQPLVQEITDFQIGPDKQELPVISTRTTVSRLMMKSTETAIIGGLMKESMVEEATKVKILGDIPLVGNLFRQKKMEKRRTDLSIFLTVTVLPEPVLPPIYIERIPAAFQVDASSYFGIPVAGTQAVLSSEKPAMVVSPTPSVSIEKVEKAETAKPTPAKPEPVSTPLKTAVEPNQKSQAQQQPVVAANKPLVPKSDSAKTVPKLVETVSAPPRDTVKVTTKTSSPVVTTPSISKSDADTTKKIAPTTASIVTKPAVVDTAKKAVEQKATSTSAVKPTVIDTVKQPATKQQSLAPAKTMVDTVKKTAVNVAPTTSTIAQKIDTTKKAVVAQQPVTSVAKPVVPPTDLFPQAEATSFFSAWLKAWSEENIDAYLASYSDEIRTDGNFEARKRGLFETSGDIQVSADSVKWMREGELWKVSFQQKYRSDIKQDTGTKTIVLRKNQSGIKIIREDFSSEK
ncbi:MAG: hypothetical protein OEM52_06820 [bacterium]|nr:hypothetical protein [bacterium]